MPKVSKINLRSKSAALTLEKMLITALVDVEDACLAGSHVLMSNFRDVGALLDDFFLLITHRVVTTEVASAASRLTLLLAY